MNKSEKNILDLYGRMMLEIQQRIGAIEILINEETTLEDRFAKESAFLQLRMICEIIASLCVVSHEGFSELKTGKLKKTYQADKIINALTELHDRFYPQPIKIKQGTPGQISITDNDVIHLTKDDLKALYAKCGELLHRGTPAGLIKENHESEWILFVKEKAQHILNLLASHALVMQGDKRSVFHSMHSGQTWIADAL